MNERLPPLDPQAMNEAQKRAAAELAAGPRGGVRGPFIALLRSPELMSRLQKVGEYLRYESALEPRLSEFVMLIVADGQRPCATTRRSHTTSATSCSAPGA